MNIKSYIKPLLIGLVLTSTASGANEEIFKKLSTQCQVAIKHMERNEIAPVLAMYSKKAQVLMQTNQYAKEILLKRYKKQIYRMQKHNGIKMIKLDTIHYFDPPENLGIEMKIKVEFNDGYKKRYRCEFDRLEGESEWSLDDSIG